MPHSLDDDILCAVSTDISGGGMGFILPLSENLKIKIKIKLVYTILVGLLKKIRIGYVLKSTDVGTLFSSRYSENSSQAHTRRHPHTLTHTCAHQCTLVHTNAHSPALLTPAHTHTQPSIPTHTHIPPHTQTHSCSPAHTRSSSRTHSSNSSR